MPKQPTPATKRQKSPKLAAPPFNPAAAKLLNELSAKDEIFVLHGFDADTKRVRPDASYRGQVMSFDEAMGRVAA